MMQYYFRLMGPGRERIPVEAEGLDDARNAAVRYLGEYLSSHPGFADEGHWQLNVENDVGQSLLHVIIATVVPRGSGTAGATGS
ncbi:hypothetical protein GCM10022268_21260 [Sphingomonas cynarae]|uniref:DUF6894 domain-containing protein n=1 Tax=Sphingomonas cynarae TaxID=930197 RepID=A0ABP7E271_9SPHN